MDADGNDTTSNSAAAIKVCDITYSDNEELAHDKKIPKNYEARSPNQRLVVESAFSWRKNNLILLRVCLGIWVSVMVGWQLSTKGTQFQILAEEDK